MSNPNIDINVSGPKQASSTYKTIVLKGNQDFASQIYGKTNHKFVIKYDFDLGLESVVIPQGCLLDFDGGSISNGTLVGQSTILIYYQGLDDIFHNVIRSGSFIYNNTLSADEESLTENGNLVSIKNKGVQGKHLNSNIVDDEDICINSAKKLQFKNRGTTDGMGRIILRRNKTFAEQLTQENTIYEIRYDFDLDGDDVTIPDNCMLQFEGGSLSGGTIDFNNCIIKADKRQTIFKELSNFYGIRKVSACWFGAKGDKATDNTDVFKFLLNGWHYKDNELSVYDEFVEIFIPRGIYKITDCINESVYSDSKYARNILIGEGDKISGNYPIENKGEVCDRTVIYCVGDLNTKPFIYAPNFIGHITIFGEKIYDDTKPENFQNRPKYPNTIGISITKSSGFAANRHFEDIQILYFGIGLFEGVSYGCDMDDIDIKRCVNGFVYESSDSIDFSNTYQIIRNLAIEFCLERGLYINTPNFESFLKFENLIVQFCDVDNIGTANTKHHIKIISKVGTIINTLYVEGSINGLPITDNTIELCDIQADDLHLSHANLYAGTYLFKGKRNVVTDVKRTGAILSFSNAAIVQNCIVSQINGDMVKMSDCINPYNGSTLGGSYISIPENGETTSQMISEYSSRKNAPFIYNLSQKEIFAKSNNVELHIPIKVGQVYIKNLSEGFNKSDMLFINESGRVYYGNGTTYKAKDANGRTMSNTSGVEIPLYGASNPSGLNNTTDIGFIFFNTTLNKPVWWNGTAWVDALGNDVSTSYITKSGTLISGNVPEFDGTDGAVKDSGKAATNIP